MTVVLYTEAFTTQSHTILDDYLLSYTFRDLVVCPIFPNWRHLLGCFRLEFVSFEDKSLSHDCIRQVIYCSIITYSFNSDFVACFVSSVLCFLTVTHLLSLPILVGRKKNNPKQRPKHDHSNFKLVPYYMSSVKVNVIITQYRNSKSKCII